MGRGWGLCQPRRYIAISELESAARLEFGQQATHVYDPEESATLLSIGQSQAKKQAFRQLATSMYDTEESATQLPIGHLRRSNAIIEYESAARLAFGQLATRKYDSEKSEPRLAIDHLPQTAICVVRMR